MLLSGGTAVITDFGIASYRGIACRCKQRRTHWPVCRWAPAYMAPDKWPQTAVDHRADIMPSVALRTSCWPSAVWSFTASSGEPPERKCRGQCASSA
jgi:hypothetical protein